MTTLPRIATITFSDTRTEADDEGGKLLRELLSRSGDVVYSTIAREDRESVDRAIADALSANVEAVVTTGGTGIAPRDIAIEAIEARLDKKLDGFGEAFRRLSFDEIGPRGVLSRALAGTIGPVLVVALPGSTKAIRLGIEQILLPILLHATDLLAGRTAHPGHAKSRGA
jgi:molybdenum cofactor biosynthesis protein B